MFGSQTGTRETITMIEKVKFLLPVKPLFQRVTQCFKAHRVSVLLIP